MKSKLLFISMFWIGMICFSQNTYVPDDNFEQALIELGYDDFLDDYVLTDNINSITTFWIFSRNIVDLTGIEDFTALTNLDCSFNNLGSLDVSQNSNIEQLWCYGNQLTSLNVSLTIKLTHIYCQDNGLNDLDLSQNTNLTHVYCYNNNLTSLDLSQNSYLGLLDCENNNLSSLNVKNGNNTNFTYFSAINNPNLECVDVDDAAYSTTNWSNIDTQTVFSEDCTPLSANEFEISGFNMYPNPVHDFLTIDFDDVANYSLINLNGQFLKSGVLNKGKNELDFSNISSGLYFLKVKTDEGVLTKKLIK